jgi:hypothetical protein
MNEFHLISQIKAVSDGEYIVSVAILPAKIAAGVRAEVVKKSVTSRSQAVDGRAALVVQAGERVRARGDVVVDVVDE